MALGQEPITSNKEINRENKRLREELTERNAQLEKISWNLEVEEALEGIRSTSMLMQHSDEIKSISETFHEQILLLGIPSEFSYVWLPDEANNSHQFWASWSAGANDVHSKQVTYPLDKSEPYTAACFKAWETPDILLEEFISPSEVVGFFDVWSELLDGAENLRAENFPDGIYYTEAYMKYGCFGINIKRKLSSEEKYVLKRFSTEFERAYTRFLDLKRAEAQAFEARIEAALEKVRSRTMAMQSSEELPEVANIMFLEIQALDIPAWNCGYCILLEDGRSSTCIMSSEGTLQKPFLLPHYGEVSFEEWDAFIKGNEFFFIQELKGDAIASHYDFMKSLSQLKPVFKDLEDAGLSLPDYQINHLCKFDHGFLLFITYSEVTYAHEIFRRFARVFNQTYTRFLDLQKAEAQAREAQIQLALERVRAQTMAMHSSKDLEKSAEIVFEELDKLDLHMERCGIGIFDADTLDCQLYTTVQNDSGETELATGITSLTIHPMLEATVEAWRSKKPLSYTLKGNELVDYYKIIRKGRFPLSEDIIEKSAGLPKEYYFYTPLSAGGLYFFSDTEPREEDRKVMDRFAEVFDMTYTRFLDLQKAEEQAREAKIEAALEKVRSRTMAMHKSTELGEVADVLFGEMNQLVQNLWTCGFVLCEKDRQEDEWWLSLEEGFSRGFFLPNVNDYAHATLYEGWLKGDSFRTVQLEGDMLQEHYDWLMEIPVAKDIFDDMEAAGIPRPEWQKLHAAYFSKGYLVIITREPCAEDSIFKRFAQVFDLTYTRFLDLQKAEAQAREAQIETALEKVRSRTMAMQHSDELQEASYLLDQQVRALGIQTWGCAFNIYGEEDSTEWFGNEAGVLHTYSVPRKGIFKEYYDKGQRGESLVIKEFSGKACVDHYEYMSKLPVLGDVLKILKETNDGFPTYQIDHVVYFKYGYLLFITREDVPEAHDIFKRFAKVFEQTYTRFLDLKKAEAQARESQIELSLERIRARVTAMQESSDLLEIVVSMRSEFVNLGHEAHYFWHMRWNPETYSKAMTSGDGSQIGMVMTLPRHIHGDIPAVAEWEKGSGPVHVLAMETETAVDYVDKMIKLGDFERVDPQAPTLDDIRHIGGLTFIMARTTHGEIGYSLPGVVPNPPKDAVDTLVRFASIFDLAYRRFEDLKKAEGQARENRIELALERIRGQVMSMEESSDLFDIVVSMRKEFLELGHQADYFWHMRWLPEVYEMSMTSEDGNRVGMVISIPKFVHDNIPNLCQWEKGTQPSFVLALDPKGAWDYIENMNTHGHYEKADPNAPTQEDIEHIGGLTFIIARTTHGEIGYSLPGVVPDPPADAVETLIRFAKVFDLAFKRFEDLKAAEKDLIEIKAARKKAEEALNELKETQTQLIQQEKLASLGQLTAGIAHEIKNPLNFVNNFSEVSLELIQEAIDEIKEIKEDERIVEAIEILGDVEFNLKKIHEHGSRANGIVSSMLLHSRGGSGKLEPSDLNALIKEYVNLSFHGMRAGREPINVDIQLDLDPNLRDVNLISEDFSRVILNICNNAFDAMRQKTKTDSTYLPVLSVATGQEQGRVKISITDNGPGIPDDLKDKILQPFFTTKKGKEGTGLGLSITHDIIKAHGGELEIHSNGEIGTRMLIYLGIK